VLGESEAAARYAGMNVLRITIIAVMLSGGLCAAVGMMQASAVEHSLSEQLSGGLGFIAVITTWLARLSPPAITAVSFLFSMLIQGGAFLQSSLQIPASISSVLQGIIIFFVLGSEFFLRYRLVFSSGCQSKEVNNDAFFTNRHTEGNPYPVCGDRRHTLRKSRQYEFRY
jgi:simple sugar transport system permease protein